MPVHDLFNEVYETYWGTDRGSEAAYEMYMRIPYNYLDLSDNRETTRIGEFILALDYMSTVGEYNAFEEYLSIYGGTMDDIDWELFAEWYESLF